MKNFIAGLLIVATTTSTFAKDSFWAICIDDTTIYGENSKLVVNIFEERARLGRATSLTLIYGGHVLRGSFDSSEKDFGVVSLKDGGRTFQGIAAVNYETNKVSLKGALNLQGKTILNATLNCKTLGK